MTEYANEMRNIENQISEIKRENKPKINSTLVGVLSLILGVILTMTYQWIM